MDRSSHILPLYLALLFLTGAIVFADQRMLSIRVDLNGDGTSENILLDGLAYDGKFVLHINALSIEGYLGDKADGFYVIDIDSQDKFKEIAIHTPGPSDDDEQRIYWYDGKQIGFVAHLARWPRYTGNRIVYVRDWMGFWEKTEKYLLDRQTHTLKLVPQEYHYVGVAGKVLKSFPIYETQDAQIVVAQLLKDSEALVVLNEGDWYLVKSATNLLGWVRESDLYTSMVLPAAD